MATSQSYRSRACASVSPTLPYSGSVKLPVGTISWPNRRLVPEHRVLGGDAALVAGAGHQHADAVDVAGGEDVRHVAAQVVVRPRRSPRVVDADRVGVERRRRCRASRRRRTPRRRRAACCVADPVVRRSRRLERLESARPQRRCAPSMPRVAERSGPARRRRPHRRAARVRAACFDASSRARRSRRGSTPAGSPVSAPPTTATDAGSVGQAARTPS